jgi:hypothetical protein
MGFWESLAVASSVKGATAFGSALLDKYRNARAVQTALERRRKGDRRSDDIVKAADLIGTALAKDGSLTEPLDKLLKLVSVTIIPQHLMECVQVGIVPQNALSLVELVGRHECGLSPEEAGAAALGIYEAIQAISESGLLPLRLTSNANQRAARERKLRRHEANLALDLDSEDDVYQALNNLSADDEATIFRDIAVNTFNAYDEIDVHTAEGSVHRVPISDVFVTPSIHQIHGATSSLRFRDLRQNLYMTNYHSISWQELLSKVDRTVLLGDPGGGKSTLSKKLCTEIADEAAKGGKILPVFVKLRSYTAVMTSGKIDNIFDFISNEIASYVPDYEKSIVESFVSYWLKTGALMVFFDGLDEVLTIPNRIQISKEIDEFCERYPLSRVLVTSRFVGYDIAPLEKFNHFAVGALSHDAISDLFDKIFISIMKQSKSIVQESRAEFLREASSKAEELISNPLMLTLIIIVHSRRREIPDNRADLYGYCAELLFERWDGYRNINPELPERYRLYDLLMHVSAILLDDDKYGGTINKKDLLSEAKAFFISDYVDNREGRASEAAAVMVDHLVGRSWILHEVGEDIFEFTHRTFLEFFYAKYLDEKYEGVEELVDAISPWVEVGNRSVSCHLVMQLRCKDKRLISSKLSARLREIVFDEKNAASVEFCAAATEYLLPDADEMALFVDKIACASVNRSYEHVLIRLLNSRSFQSEVIRDVVGRRLAAVTSVKDLRALHGVWSFLSRFGAQTPGLAPIHETIQKELLPRFESLQKKSPYVCRIFFDFGLTPDWQTVRYHGLKLWSDTVYPTPLYDSRISQLRDGIARLIEVADAEILPQDRFAYFCRLTLIDAMCVDRPLKVSRYARWPALDPDLKPIKTIRADNLEAIISGLCALVEISGEYSVSRNRPIVSTLKKIHGSLNAEHASFAFLNKWVSGEVSIFSPSVGADVRSKVFQDVKSQQNTVRII